jgi:NAD(P)-dependent dehydrogenase (short-subunit alcohol dehydrogenase family)
MFKPFDLAGKVALVTGGNGGIGLGMAEALAQGGAEVCIWGTNAGKNEAAKARLAKTGRKVEALVVDVSDEGAAEAAMGETVKRLGRVDACFANAGVTGSAKSVFDIDAAEWRRVLAVNLDGAFFTLRAAARHMAARQRRRPRA